MQSVWIQRAGQLPEDIRSALEHLLGRPIGADEEISVVSVPPQEAPPSESRAAIARKLEAFLNRRADKVHDIAAGEIEAAIDQAVHDVRHSRR